MKACDAYLRFAKENRGLYRLMFASSLLRASEEADQSRVAREAFTLLLDRVRRCSGSPNAQVDAIWVWSTLHGLAMLDAEQITAGPLRCDRMSLQVVRRMVDQLMRNKEQS